MGILKEFILLRDYDFGFGMGDADWGMGWGMGWGSKDKTEYILKVQRKR